ncbi:2OG-Fe(II) oxygenase [Niallia taxi]|uniref:2OG-Fe(II) oxygenase n=1 Tax=Niallia taxi TaxID=2499688 RepID=UPI0023A9FC5C|nr:2OG-Fe(II) oxygenase [Niallia taxi]MDE5054442.1 2OG-Fe(II) oxygenase [Niallia taxi]MED3961511.1 2OG-Fe(II) oxygenase [Niallia taxi]
MKTSINEESIFYQSGDHIIVDDRKINIVTKFDEPLIIVLDNVLSNQECNQLIEFSKDNLKRSKISSSGEGEVNDIRTSSSMFFQGNENDILEKLEKRISAIMCIPIEHAEGIQILKYTPGQEYKAHFDFFNSASKAAKNNRISTLVIYLNDVEEGGETYFPKLNLSISPKKGSAVYFEYFYNNEDLNELTLHGGAPVIKGEKWVATQWMRKQKIR